MSLTVGQLKKLLQKYPQDMEVIVSKYSDYQTLKTEGCLVIKVVSQDWGIMSSCLSMSLENKAKEKEYLLLTCT